MNTIHWCANLGVALGLLTACGEHPAFTESSAGASSQQGADASAAQADGNGASTPAVDHTSDGNATATGTVSAGSDSTAGDIEGTGEGSSSASGSGSGSGKSSASGGMNSLIGVAKPTPTQIAAACKTGTPLTKAQAILFTDPKQTCDWGINGNGAIQDGKVRARREQVQTLSLPTGAVICDLAFDFTEQSMRYDDEIILALNNKILAASQDYGQFFAKSGSLEVYDWTKILDIDYAHDQYPQYCLGASDGTGHCVIPETETTGTMSLQFDPSLIHELSADAIATGRFDLTWVTTGDNDSSDCQHSDFGFSVTVQYLSP